MNASKLSEFTVLGYDIRRSFKVGGDPSWTPQRRAEFLICPEIPWPLSVDDLVWPNPVQPTKMHPFHLWGSIEEALALVSEFTRTGSDIPIVIEIAALHDQELSVDWARLVGSFLQNGGRPESDSADALGFDVADRYLVSGLSNCMPSAGEMIALRLRWSLLLNSFGLFRSADDAMKFKVECDARIPEHAPFYVYRIVGLTI